MFPKKLIEKIELRKQNNALRKLDVDTKCLVDFSSNDYIGFSKSKAIYNNTIQYLKTHHITANGATGSRLLSGNHGLYAVVEQQLSAFYKIPSALVFNSGYNANVGFFSSIPQRGDVILYDAFIHASIRDGMLMSNAKAYKFEHNNLSSLTSLLERFKNQCHAIYVVTESVFSMDGDTPDLISLTQLCKKHDAFLVVDEAHAVGVFGENGAGLVQSLNLQRDVFARIVTFGKALGCHGAAILGSELLKQYLVNFSRSFIYTTALSPHSLAAIHVAYNAIAVLPASKKIDQNIIFFKAKVKALGLESIFITSQSAIHCCVIAGNVRVKNIAQKIRDAGFNVKAILSPTVPKNKERLRFCLHSYNTHQEISDVLELLQSILTENCSALFNDEVES